MSTGALPSPLDRRRAGLLLHPTSLPGGIGTGDLGPDAYHFVDFLAAAGFSVWQTLPLGPVHADLSPYRSQSSHAGNEYLISLELLVDEGWLAPDQGPRPGEDPCGYRRRRLLESHAHFQAVGSAREREALDEFVRDHSYWLEDYALFQVLRKVQHDVPWWDWPVTLRDRRGDALRRARGRHAEALAQVRFEQFLFFRQWQALRRYANERAILVFGDIPLFVSDDSADVWAQRRYFQLDESGRPSVVAGVPPDYFSATGQRWGNPQYDWERLQADGFEWWVQRLRTQLEQFDLLRIDHFRGLESYWEIAAHEPTAMNGRWVPAPGAALLATLAERFSRLPLVAEDLGYITPEVDVLRERFGLPGMKILQFAFGGAATNPYLPHNHSDNCVVYTGTHDNNTTLGWYQDLDPGTRHHVLDYLGCSHDAMPGALVRAALASVARLAVLPMQDILRLGGGERMNSPGTERNGNWSWRFTWDQVTPGLDQHFRHQLGLYARLV